LQGFAASFTSPKMPQNLLLSRFSRSEQQQTWHAAPRRAAKTQVISKHTHFSLYK
jgi:hypothetical protein